MNENEIREIKDRYGNWNKDSFWNIIVPKGFIEDHGKLLCGYVKVAKVFV